MIFSAKVIDAKSKAPVIYKESIFCVLFLKVAVDQLLLKLLLKI